MNEILKKHKKILEDFCVWDKMAEFEKLHFKSLKTEISIENFQRDMILRHLEEAENE